MPFASLGIEPPISKGISALGHVSPTPVQAESIPAVLSGSDVWVAAPTGSGKTGAYLLPTLQSLWKKPCPSPRRVRALILVPTRELAVQVEQDAQSYGRFLQPGPKCCICVGGVSINPQMMALRGGADLVVATPGRLLDLVAHNAMDLSAVEIVVLDEADRLLSFGFSAELEQVQQMLPPKCQKLLLSATFPPAVQGLAQALLRDPVRINVQEESQSIPAAITQRAISVDTKRRTKLLRHLISAENWHKTLVFVGSGQGAQQLAAELRHAGSNAGLLHGRLSQEARSEALAAFKGTETHILVATDLAARGIDVPQLSAVVNYDLPRSPVDYIHRIGRTGRAGQVGVAVSLVTAATEAHFKLIEKKHQLSIPREQIKGFIPVETARFVQPTDPSGGIKGRRKSKKDKLREAASRAEEKPTRKA